MARVYDDKTKYLDSRLQFQNLSKNTNAIIREFGVTLNFKGFVETLVSYMKTDEMTPVGEIEELLMVFNHWIEYLGDVKTIVFYYKNHFEIIGDLEKDIDKKKEYQNKFFILKTYEKALQKQETVFNRAFKNLLFQYEEKHKQYMRVTEG